MFGLQETSPIVILSSTAYSPKADNITSLLLHIVVMNAGVADVNVYAFKRLVYISFRIQI